MSNPQVLDNRTWSFLYSQITSGQIGTQILLDSSNVNANPLYGSGLFRATNTGNPTADKAVDNFYSGVNVTISNLTSLTSDALALANYYGQKSNGAYQLLGYMTNTPTSFPANPALNFTGLTNGYDISGNIKYHTLLFNSNAPNGEVVIQLTYYNLTFGSLLTENIVITPLTLPMADNLGANYIYQLKKPNNFVNLGVIITQASNFTTNVVGILKTDKPLTPDNLVCFAENSMVLTPNGEIPIQNLSKGDIVYDEKYNLQTVEFVAKRTFFPTGTINKYSIPYEIKQGKLGQNVPNRDTIVSAAHLIKHNGLMVPASKLGTPVDMDTMMTYYNVSVSNYSTMIVNGMVSETLDTSNDKKQYEKIF
jgi:hypothetical protein